MCISRFIGLNELNKSVGDLEIDFVDFLDDEKLKEELQNRFKHNDNSTIISALNGLANEKVIQIVVSLSRIYGDTKVSKLDEEDIDNLVYNFKHFIVSINGTKGFDNSQVTAGGVDLSDINLDTMESKNTNGLYFIGEVLDVDGICGGYNLTWAYTSAAKAAKGILREV